ncbi:MAG: ribonuclease HII [Candidatus Paceibacterota bacterium]|jgi:ribonuclease HII
MDLQVERNLWRKGFKTVVGLDEAGRGPLAGPVVAGAVAVDRFMLKRASSGRKKELAYLLEQVNDSKKLNSKKREELYSVLVRSSFIKWGIARVSEKKIDRINIFEASRLAMVNACADLLSKDQKKQDQKIPSASWPAKIEYLVIDGNFALSAEALAKAGVAPVGQQSVIKGDQKVFSIAAASILAKVYRDRIMLRLDKKYPQYGFARHKGYPTKIHKENLKVYGPAVIHRKSFGPVCFYSRIKQA